MRSNSNNSTGACAEWQAEIESVLNTVQNSEIRHSWERHALTCEECVKLLKSDREIVGLIREMQAPGHSSISAFVMGAIISRSENSIEFKAQHVVWGFSTAIVGFILGFILSGLSLEPFHAAGAELYFEQTLVDMGTGMDSLVTVFGQYDGDSSNE